MIPVDPQISQRRVRCDNIHDGEVQMINSSIVSVHQHASGVRNSGVRCVGRSRRGLTTKFHAHVDSQDRLVKLLTRRATTKTSHCRRGLARRAPSAHDRPCRQGLCAESVRSCIRAQGAIPNIPNRSNRKRRSRWKRRSTERETASRSSSTS